MLRQAITAQLGRGFPVLTGKYCIAQTGRLLIHRQRFSCFDGKYTTESTAILHRQERTSQLGRRFPVLTGKYSTEGTAINAQVGKDSPAIFLEVFFLTGKYSTYSLCFSDTDRNGNHSFAVVFFMTGKYSTHRLGFSYTDRHGHHSLEVVFIWA